MVNNMSLSIIIYTHKHGTDSWVTNEGDVRKSILNCILDNIGDVEIEDRKRLLLEILAAEKTGSLRPVCDLWSELTDEYFESKPVFVPPNGEDAPWPVARELLAETEKEILDGSESDLESEDESLR